MTQLAASVIVPTSGDALRLRWALEALCHQTRSDFEVVVVDDAPLRNDDDALEAWSAFRTRLDTQWHYLLPRSDDFRKSMACNLAVRHSRGRTLLFLDEDMVADQDWVEAHLAQQAVASGVVYGLRRHLHESWVGDLSQMKYKSWKYLLSCMVKKCTPVDRRLERDTPHWHSVYGCSMSMPAADYCEIGGYDERFKNWGCEDNDLADRMRRKGLPLHCLTESGLATHLDHPLRHRGDGVSPNVPLRDQAQLEPILRNGGPLRRHNPAPLSEGAPV